MNSTESKIKSEPLLLLSPTAAPESDKIEVEGVGHYLHRLISLALPNTFTSLMWVSQSIISLYFVGKLNSVIYIDAYSLSLSWSYIFAFSFLGGLSSGMDTLVSQSFGREDYRACGLHLCRGFLVVEAASLPCYFFMYLSGPALRLIGVDASVAEHAYYCALSLMLVIFFYIPQTLVEKFMLGQRIATPQMVIQVVNTCLYPLYCYGLMFGLGLGYLGAIGARAVAEILYTAGMISYLWVTGRCSRSVVRPSMEVFHGWGKYLALALPSMMMICLEYWACVGLAVLCAKLGVVDLAAHAVSCNYGDIIFSICMGMGSAISTLVGNSIGERRLDKAKKYTSVGIAFTGILVTAIELPVLVFRRSLILLFTTEPAVVDKLCGLMFLVALRELFDGSQCALGRTLIGMGRQRYASKVNLVVYYLFMVPAAFLLGDYLGYGVTGVWVSTTLSAMAVTGSFLVLIWRQDWELLASEAEARGNAN